MKALSLALVLLVTTPPWNSAQGLPPQNLEESDSRNPLGFHDEDLFNTNDSSCVIIDGVSLDLQNCHEHVVEPIPTTSWEIWGTALGTDRLEFPVEYVLIKDGGRNCNSTAECTSQIQSMRKRAGREGCDLSENFYVGGDGNLYDGRGWNLAPYWHLNGLRNKSITVQFLGSHESTPPSPEALEAFETAMEIALWQGKLSNSYKVSSIRQLLKDSAVSEDLLSQNPLGTDRWWTGEELSSLWEYMEPDRLRFVLRRHWNASKPTKELDVISQPVDYVMISEGDGSCLGRAECSSRMKAVQTQNIEHYGDLLDNFYIGDGGEVYEGRGWNFAPHWYLKGFKNRYISIRLFGSFANELPSLKAINSLKLLVKTGVWLGKISSDLRLFSLRQVYNQSILLGSPLQEHVRRWSIWSEDIFFQPDLPTAGHRAFISRSEWKAVSPNSKFSRTNQPVKYVMIGDGGSRCFSIENCTSKMRLEQNLCLSPYGDLLDNFYVGDDGIVYEGRGWDVLPFLHTPFFNRSLITVKFLGSFQSSQPSQSGWLAFLALLDAGISSGKISQDYKIYSFRHIYNDSSLLGDKISQIIEEMTEWDGQLSLASEDQLMSSGILPIYNLEPSTSHVVPKKVTPLSLPVDYVVVGGIGDRCFTRDRCRRDLEIRQAVECQSLGDLAYNFYVGEDGSVYSGRGWSSASHWHVTGVKANTLFVAFSGRFKYSLPSRYALLALNRLLKFGAATGKIATDYKIISVRQLFPNSTHAGGMLDEEIKSLGRWSEYEALSPGGTSIPFGPSAFVGISKWSARGVLQYDSDKVSYPIPSVVVLDVDDSCFNMEDCILRIQAEQRRVHPQFGSTMENFYIGEDGRIYEGRGWSQKTHWNSRIRNFDFITVAFLGKFQVNLPSSKAFTAFEYWTKEGIMEEKLASNFTVVSMRQLMSSGQVPGEALNVYVKTLDNWLNDTSQAMTFESFTIFPTSAWGRSLSIRRSNAIIHPLKYVYIREGGLRCSSQNECISRMKAAEQDKDAITENFYIGGTGVVFEGIGWQYDTKWGYNGWKSSISVMFLGTFTSELPTPQALSSFDYLCQYGLQKGYIASDYKILYIPDKYNSKVWVGAKFKELIKSWKRWVQNV